MIEIAPLGARELSVRNTEVSSDYGGVHDCGGRVMEVSMEVSMTMVALLWRCS